jgi:signal transduction histidine kinase/ActR/RegA family two-component response regulator
MLLVDARSRTIARANAALGALVGWADEEALTGRPLRTLDPADGGEIAEYLLLALACRDSSARARIWRTRAGDVVPVEIRAVRLHGDQGTLLALYVRDLREDARARHEHEALRSELWLAQKHETVGRLAAGLAHDFNELLTAVVLSAEAVRDRTEDARSRVDLDGIADAALHAHHLTRELLAYTTCEPEEPRPLRLDDLLVATRGLLRHVLPGDIRLVLRPCGGHTVVRADPGQIQQVLVNLVVNARDAMPGGGFLVVATREVVVDASFVREHPALRHGPHVLLSVTDTGEGMDEETCARLFEPFFSTRDDGDARGLGLFTVRGMVRRCGGEVCVTTQAGVGSTLQVYLPRLRTEVGVPAPRRPARGGPVPGGSEHILLVEDDDAVRQGTARALRRLGYRVTEAAGPEEALGIHEKLWPDRGPHPVDLVVTDVVMPGMTGPEMVRRLRTKREDLPVLYVSGYLGPEREGRAEPSGSIDHLAKPFTLAELGARLRRFLDRVSAPAEGPPDPPGPPAEDTPPSSPR